MTRIVVVGYYGLGNVGDESILSGIITSIHNKFYNPEIFVFSGNPIETSSIHHVNSIKHSLKESNIQLITNILFSPELFEIKKFIDNCDYLVLGGGELLQDLNMITMPMIHSILKYARSRKKKIIIFGIGAGPLQTILGKKITKSALNNVDLITVRDNKSKSWLEHCGVNSSIVTADPAFILTNDNDRKRSVFDRIGVTIPTRLYNDDLFRYNNSNIDVGERRKNLFGSILNIPKSSEKSFELIPTVNNDIIGYKYIISLFSNHNNISIADYTSDPAIVLKNFKRLDLLFGVRLHSLILSSISNVPFIPISYCDKVTDFSKLMGTDKYLLNVEDLENNFFEQLLEKYHLLINNYSSFQTNNEEKCRIMRRNAYKTVELMMTV